MDSSVWGSELVHAQKASTQSWEYPRSFAMREKGGNRLVSGLDYMVDALKLSNQAPRVTGESLQTCPDGTQHLFCWAILISH
ncbi:hypothetical protein TNCV_2753171 [Trichonephila clavipes]|nr:hypothetical protein TNCV_2753171 [Trichonephila clavipes]